MRRVPVRWKSAAAGALGAFVMGCASTPPPAHPAELFGWNANGLVGETSIVIDLRKQRAEVYIGGQLAGWTAVATGKEGFNTRAGDYTVLEKVVDKYSTLYGKTVTADGSTFKADADVRKDRPAPRGKLCLCAHALLDAPYVAWNWNARRPDSASWQPCFARLYPLTGRFCAPALRCRSPWHPGSDLALRNSSSGRP